MEPWMALAGLGLSFGGAVILAVADAWLSRSILVYLDAIEANVGQLVAAVRAGGMNIRATDIDLRRDRGQNRARAVKMLGWLILALGFALQFASAYRAHAAA